MHLSDRSCHYWLRILSLCFLLGSMQSLEAATYHVSPAGDDSHTGTAEQPLLTVSRGAELAQPGDTVLVHEGVYRERVAPPRGGEASKPITYIAAPGERVIIKGSEQWQPAWTQKAEGVFFAVPDGKLFNDIPEEYVDSHNPFEVELASTPWQREGRREKERGYRGDDSIVYTCGQIFVDGKRYREVPFHRELKPGCWHYEASTKRIYVHFGELAPAEHLVEITTRRRIFAPTKRGLGYITVQGFIMEHCGNQYPTNFWEVNANAQKGALGIEAGHHWIIRRNLVRHAKTFAIDAGYVDKRSRKLVPEDNLIEENYVVDNGSAGILSNASRNMVIRGNVILRNNVLRFFELKRWEQAGIKCHNFKDGLIEGNYVADNTLTYGIWLDNQFPDSRISRNVLVNNGRAGLFLEMSDYDFDRLLVDNNVIVGNRENPVYIHDASGATFVNNLLADTKPSSVRGQGVFIRQVSARTKTYHHSFYNNLLLSNAAAIDANYPSHRSGPQRFDFNVYSFSADDEAFRINRASEKPSPWSSSEFNKVVTTDANLPTQRESEQSDRYVPLTFGQWQSFWQAHGLDNDANSTLSPTSSAKYDAATQELTLVLDADPDQLPSLDHPKVDRDFFGVATAKPLVPGPFQSIQHGLNTFRVWEGLALLAVGELPAEDWNRTKTASTDGAKQTETLELRSPNGRTRLQFTLADLLQRDNAAVYRVFRDKELLVDSSLLGLKLTEKDQLHSGFQIIDSSTSTHDETWNPIHGERNEIRDHYNELQVRLQQPTNPARELQITFRCYDEGVAFRYRVTGDQQAELKIENELTHFKFVKDHTVWATEDAQGKHRKTKLSKLNTIVERPLTMRVKPDLYLAIAEAALDNYASMMLKRTADDPHQLVSSLTGDLVSSKLPLQTPWRVLMIADSPGQLLEQNDLIRNLNEPCQIADTSWLRPGKVLREMTLTTDGGLAAVDFAEKYNFQHIEFDAGWYGHEYDDASDATTIDVDPKRSPGPLDLHRVIRYAKSKNIGVLVYVNRRALERQLDEILPLYKSWGLSGVKYGFVKTGNQKWTNWLHEAIRKAAQHELMIDVHDSYRSTGYQRTYPNFMTMEGIGGDESLPTNELALTNLFTRMLAGRADHTYCYYADRVDELQTHACQLAKPVCFFSPWQFLFWYDTPLEKPADNQTFATIQETPELDFYRHMPTVWDDTRVLHASIGEFALVARRSGAEWFLGAINNGKARVLETPLSFLDPDREYVAHRYYDDPQLDTPTQVAIKEQIVTQSTVLKTSLLSNGGEAIRIVPRVIARTAEKQR